jgi:DNA-binding NtrC family response regulator
LVFFPRRPAFRVNARYQGELTVAKVILVGADVALLEGLAQTLIGFGHAVSFATTVAEAAGSLSEDLPAMAVVSSQALEEGGVGMTLPLSPGGALIVYGTSHADQPYLPTKLQRATLAHLVLPLERHRLLALVQSFDNRSRTTGRSIREEPDDDFRLQI